MSVTNLNARTATRNSIKSSKKRQQRLTDNSFQMNITAMYIIHTLDL